MVQKHKVVALRGNGTLRADPRVSSSAEDVARGFFFFFLFSLYFSIIKREIAFPRGPSKGREGNASEFNRRRDGKVGGSGSGRGGRTRARRTAFAVVRKEQPNAFNAYYQSSIHKRATRFVASLKKVTSSLAKNYYAVYNINVDHEKRDERTNGLGGCPASGARAACIPKSYEDTTARAKQPRASGG